MKRVSLKDLILSPEESKDIAEVLAQNICKKNKNYFTLFRRLITNYFHYHFTNKFNFNINKIYWFSFL